MRYNAFFGELPLNAFKPRPGGGMTLEGGGNPISAVTDAVSDVVDTVGDIGQTGIDLTKEALKPALAVGKWSWENPVEAAALGAAGWYFAPEISSWINPGTGEAVVGTSSGVAAGATPTTTTALTGTDAALADLATSSPMTPEAASALADSQAMAVTAGTPDAGTALSNVAGNADKAALYGDAGYGAGMTGAETGAYDAGLAAGGAANAAANAGSGAVAGKTLADIAPYTAGANLAGAYLQSNAAKDAADMQTAAANNAIAQQQKNFETINAQQAPYRATGYSGLNEIAKLSSGQTPTYDYQGNIVKDAAGNPVMQTGSGYLTKQFSPEDFAAGIDPGYAFRLQQGQMANQRASNLAGGGFGGNALRGLQDYTQGLASQEYGNAFNRFQTQRQNIYNTLASIAGIGQTGQTATNTAATNATNAATQLGVGSAAVQAGATKGSAAAYGNAINDITNAYTTAALLNQRGNVTGP